MTESSNDDVAAVELPEDQWDVVLHILEDHIAQLEPEGEWIGKYPGEESAVGVEDARENIVSQLD